MNFSRRKTAITLVLIGFWLKFCAFQPSIKSSSLKSNELHFFTTNLQYSKYPTIFNSTTPELLNHTTLKNHEVSFKSTKSFNSKYTAIFGSTPDELSHTTKLKRKFWYDDQGVISRTSDCEKYFKQFVPVPGVDEEYLFHENISSTPLAFSHLVHTQSAILEVFLAMYFRPNNFYCFHVDKKSDKMFKKAITNLINCYSYKTKHGKIFQLSKTDSFSVDWGGNTMLKADLKCLSNLLALNHQRSRAFRWSHSVSIAGSELPIVTYSTFSNTIDRKLGPNLSSVESFRMPKGNYFRISKEQKKNRKLFLDGRQKDNVFELSIPLNRHTNSTTAQISSLNQTIQFKLFKGIRNVILSFEDADFLLNHKIARALLHWISKGSFTEEHFYSTAIRFRKDRDDPYYMTQNLSTKEIRKNSGGITFTSGNTLHGLCPRFTNWYCVGCFGKCLNAICNFNIKDLDKIHENSTECLIANKFNLNVDPSAVSQQWIKILRMMRKEMKHDGNVSHPFSWNETMKKVFKLVAN